MKIRINRSVVLRQLDELKAHCKIMPSGCWEWQRSRTAAGYGNRRFADRVCYTHRLALKFDGRLVEGLQALHRCDNPPCCNPAHLFSGTQKDNIADCISKGRVSKVRAKGEAHGNARLTAAKVTQIRLRASEGPSALARTFGVSAANISLVLKREAWKHIPPC